MWRHSPVFRHGCGHQCPLGAIFYRSPVRFALTRSDRMAGAGGAAVGGGAVPAGKKRPRALAGILKKLDSTGDYWKQFNMNFVMCSVLFNIGLVLVVTVRRAGLDFRFCPRFCYHTAVACFTPEQTVSFTSLFVACICSLTLMELFELKLIANPSPN